MAAPADMTTKNYSGVWQMNKKLGDDYDEILSAQGVGFMKRKAMGAATLTITLRNYVADGIEHLETAQKATGIAGSTDVRALDWSEKHNEGLFGPVKTQIRRARLDELENPFLKSGWTADAAEQGVIHMRVTSAGNKEWVIDQVWGFEDIKGERRYARKVYLTYGDGKKLEKRLVYDYMGPAA
ncbi:hypothetical protein PENSPDRAFT_277453 [Peniophora sp. CONT]|nr:hypothetical protein PENSPDRAFT_277453 [Peniophora sp. CONT]